MNGNATRTAHSLRTAPALARLLSNKTTHSSSRRQWRRRRHRRPAQALLCIQEPPVRARVSSRLVGNRDGRPKAERTLSTIIHGRRHGLTLAGSNISACTVDKTAPAESFSSSLCLSLGHYLAAGKCDLQTQPECTLLTTTPKRRLGTTRACPHLWIRTFHNTSAISGGSSSTSAPSLLCAFSLASATSKCAARTFLKIPLLRSLARPRMT